MTAILLSFVTLLPIWERSIVMSMSVYLCACVCMFVCLRSYLRNYTFNLNSKLFVLVTDGRGSIHLWRRSLVMFYVMDDVMFAHKPRFLDVAAQLKCSAHAALGLAVNFAQ